MGATLGALGFAAGGILSWASVGLLTGWLADMFMRGGGYGVFADFGMGLLGGLLGGYLCSLCVVGETGPGSMVIAFAGACALIAGLRAVAFRAAL